MTVGHFDRITLPMESMMRDRVARGTRLSQQDVMRLTNLFPATNAQYRLFRDLTTVPQASDELQQEAVAAAGRAALLKGQLLALLPSCTSGKDLSTPQGRERAVEQALALHRLVEVVSDSQVAATVSTPEEAADWWDAIVAAGDGPGEPELALAGVSEAPRASDGSDGPPRTPLILTPNA